MKKSTDVVKDEVTQAFDAPDAPPTTTGLNIPRAILNKTSPSKMYEDEGLKMQVISDICNRGMFTDFPTNRKTVAIYYNEFIKYCYEYKIPPTLSLFSMWCGTTIEGYNKYMKQNVGSDLGNALQECKEALRSFIELSAMQGEVDKLIYFHQQKGYYDVVEKVEIKHEVEDVVEEMTNTQIDAVLSALPPLEVDAEVKDE